MKKRKIVLSFIISFILVNNSFANDMKSLDTVTVTAQKMEENIQDVPVSLTVFDEFAIEDRNIKSVKDIAQYTPNFTIFNPGDWGTVAPSIRGLYSDVAMTSSTVSMYIDGVPTQSTMGYDAVLEDIERIEVLKGPQGTLYGKNAEAGAINIITKKPNNETKGKIGLEFGSDNKKAYTFNASGAIIKDKFYVGVSGKLYEKDGYMTNKYLNTDHNNRKSKYGKVNLRYTPTDNLDISFISSKHKRDDGALSVNKATAQNLKEVNNDVSDFAKLESTAHSLKIDYNFGQYNLSSVTAYKKDHDLRFADYDYSTVKSYHSLMDVTYENLSQEVKLNSQTDTLTWLAGIYADKSESKGGTTVDSIYPSMRARGNQNTTEDSSLGLFSHANYKINDKLSILGGLRYDIDEKSLTDKKTNTKLDMSYSEISPKLAFN
ncbi:TonB-dependent receptor [Sulfurimonas sp.]|uniref:TonB-dependent receptor n=1 Tax=Sulfurimonas sp. TaxID=2022749 RepID=UPI002B47E10A|nr:TonB-dependent receptor [Sulfurimonas sp.]